ncbi:MAG: hypothetical protein LBP54_02790 [Campylobacteraceae bacterium]|jgi:hypothetical protein|nr:hypothetical protein [Campylobacteraceae bacterium]
MKRYLLEGEEYAILALMDRREFIKDKIITYGYFTSLDKEYSLIATSEEECLKEHKTVLKTKQFNGLSSVVCFN